MGTIHQKYLSLQVNDDHIQDFIDPFQLESDQFDDNASINSSQIMSNDSSHNDDDSSWVPEDDVCSEIIDDDEQSNYHDYFGNTSTDHAKDNIFVRATSNFNMRDASVSEDTNKLLSPVSVIKYKLRHTSEKPKSSTIVMLFNPSTPDKMSVTLANIDIICPFVHDIKREQLYTWGYCGLLYDPVSSWIKFEECTLNLGRATSVEDNNTDTNGENSMDDSQDSDQGANRHNFQFLNNMYHAH
jgi:hypothetical protein